ncbi:arabinosidase [Segetibacter sp. 3557_3]|uniref:glycoside hydrolase family 43 protein n=1 Tax=Segetibacter sp. 3557_3 TaxID=2547429 RepID=UPI001058F86A|nr:glycoside hydrolase family 43 protein [Segetibacter sp. 3557_3]TDH27450.1 arabinosidase [Segetibacter sp. 3557_3]
MRLITHLSYLIVLFASCSVGKNVYLFTSFHEPATAGLRMLYSHDGYKWNDFDTVFIRPQIGDKVMRDPSIVQGPDGNYHFVWTLAWKGNKGFGYASSKDLINWSEQRAIDVMANESTAVNVWAPELFYDDEREQFIIIWATTIPKRFPRGIEEEDNNHRMYYVTTKDFKTFSDTKLFLDPGFSVIDCVIVKRGKEDYVLVLKDNTRPARNIKIAFSKHPLGPFTKPSEAFTPLFTEGPAVAKVKDGYLVYYDQYREKIYGAQRTSDFINFTDATKIVSVPEGHKHGTIFKADKKRLKALLRYSGK